MIASQFSAAWLLSCRQGHDLGHAMCRDKIEELAGSLQFPLKKLFVIDGSTRSAHSNAYM